MAPGRIAKGAPWEFFDKAKNAAVTGQGRHGAGAGRRCRRDAFRHAGSRHGRGDEIFATSPRSSKVSGVEAPAVIKTIRRGEADMGGGIQAEVDVSIEPADGAADDATIKQSILPSWLDTLDAGSRVSIKYDPDSPTSALM